MIWRALLTVGLIAFWAMRFASVDGSRDAALYVGEGPGDFTTIQSAFDAITKVDFPRTILLEAGKTYTETVEVRRQDRDVTIDGRGAVLRPNPGCTRIAGVIAIAGDCR